MHEDLYRRLKENALTAKGETPRELREQVWHRARRLAHADAPQVELEPELAQYVELITTRAQNAEDEDIVKLRAAGFGDDALFEITVTTAVSAGMARLDRALTALKGGAK